MLVLFEHAQKRELLAFKLQAAMHGAKVNFDEFEGEQTEDDDLMPFKDPEEYSHLTQEQKEELTERMMGTHKKWAGSTTVLKVGAKVPDFD